MFTDHSGASLMELFIHGPGGEKMRTSLSTTSFLDEQPGAIWSTGLLKIVKCMASLMYPLISLILPEFQIWILG